ncbi:F-actin capping protein alpha-1 subunit [Syncephalastrum racemosum]|uniref:F-actin-capping protein subunit alpha n=1 Tax=Syncephalastrum racemosum TaxID=13706 RepID=A0A1X2HBF6_SYNRA|nr:F-actin capping protein alpha-1 subunit [Syncephalastrum racemosum]
MEAAIDEKVRIASDFLLASPPGEVNDVFNDVRTLIDNDEALQEGILTALEQYNTEQLITVKLPGSDQEVIVSSHGKTNDDRYLDPRSKQTFRFDHMRLTASEVLADDSEKDSELDQLRSLLESEATKYVNDHYPDGVCTVYASAQKLVIAIVDNKFNPSNYWNGRWRATWSYDTQSGGLEGVVQVNVHYYEDGNVQLNSQKKAEATVSSEGDQEKVVTAVVKEIAAAERKYQAALNDSYSDLAEDTFKGLRRTLPMTRNKLDWNKVLNYKIGSELAQKSDI